MKDNDTNKTYDDLLYSTIYKNKDIDRKELKKKALFAPWPENIFLMILGTEVEINDVNVPIKALALRKENISALEYLLSTLSYKERTVILYRYQKKLSLYDTGEKIGLSRERVRQIENRTISKMQQYPYSEWLIYGERYINKSVRDEIQEGSLSIESLELGTRAYNCLRRAGIRKISDLYNLIEFDNYDDPFINLRQIRYMGINTLNELIYKLNLFINKDDIDKKSEALEKTIKQKYTSEQIKEMRELVYMELIKDSTPEIKVALAKKGYGLNILVKDPDPRVRDEAKKQIDKLSMNFY